MMKMKIQASYYDQTGEYPSDILKKAWEVGLLNNHVHPKFGGLGLSALNGVLIAEEMAYGCSGIWTAAEGNNLAEAPIIVAGSDEQKKEFLGRMIANPLMASYCVTEPGAGSDVANITTKARQLKPSSEWVLSGTKMWITNANFANWFFVLAKTDDIINDSKKDGSISTRPSESLTGFIVEKDSPGSRGKIIIGKKEKNMGQRASDTRCVTFEEVVIPDSQRLGPVGGGFKIAMKAFDMTRPVIAAAAVGVARRAFTEAANYAIERKTMGEFIWDHQSIGNIIADMATSIQSSRGLVWKAAYELDSGRRASLLASMAKWMASKAAVQATSNAIQIYGGLGYNSEAPVEKLYRDAKLFEIYEGTSQIQQMVISKLLKDSMIKADIESVI